MLANACEDDPGRQVASGVAGSAAVRLVALRSAGQDRRAAAMGGSPTLRKSVAPGSAGRETRILAICVMSPVIGVGVRQTVPGCALAFCCAAGGQFRYREVISIRLHMTCVPATTPKQGLRFGRNRAHLGPTESTMRAWRGRVKCCAAIPGPAGRWVFAVASGLWNGVETSLARQA